LFLAREAAQRLWRWIHASLWSRGIGKSVLIPALGS
jgi:hypothetical protein